jgi:glutamyl-tRNA synthetase
LPYVAEPGSKSKLSKRKLDKYLKNKEFAGVYEHGRAIAERLGLTHSVETFNPVIVDFYREVGYLPEAVINYLLLLGWSLDEKTEYFSREEMVGQFSLERVNKAPASFDAVKLQSFQDHYMAALPEKQKVAMVLPYLQQAGLVGRPPACDISDHLRKVLQAAGDRIRTAGDILDYDFLFQADDDLQYDELAFARRIVQPPDARELLSAWKDALAKCEPYTAANLQAAMHDFIERREIKIGQIIHALRVATTGRSVGFGMFETLEILGRESTLARIERALARAGA